jgi:hypothetical protein
MEIKITLNGTEKIVTKNQLFDLAANGTLKPDSTVSIDGQSTTAAKIKGLTFGVPQNQQTSTSQISSPSSDSAQVEIKVVLNGFEKIITKKQLLDLAANGTIRPDTNISFGGRLVAAAKVKGITFAQPQNPTQNDFPFPFDNSAGNNPFAEFPQQFPQQEFLSTGETIQQYPQYSSYNSGSYRRSSGGGGNKAIASFVLGCLSTVTCGGIFILPIIGLVLGILGVNSKNKGFAIAGIVLSCLCIFLSFISLALLLPAVQAAREAARRMICLNNEIKISEAFNKFHETHKAFPALYTVDKDDKPLHSWRVLILPFIGEADLYKEIRLNEPWDSEYNKQFHSRMPPVYACPSSPNKTTKQCCYSAIVGEGLNKDPKLPAREGDRIIANIHARRMAGFSKHSEEDASLLRQVTESNMIRKYKKGILTPAEKVDQLTGTTNFDSVTDGLSNTLLVIEVKEPFCWMDPAADITFKDLGRIRDEKGSHHPNGFNVVSAGGKVYFLPNDTDTESLISLGTRNGGEKLALQLQP